MQFIQPSFLWALGLLAVPIIIHLFNFKRHKKVAFSNVRMLKRIDTQSKKTRQIKKWLVLLTRMLALSALVLAFARPYLPSGASTQGKVLHSIYIDNSFSMSASGEKGPLLEEAKQLARDLIDRMPQEWEIRLLSNGVSSSKGSDKGDIEKQIDQLYLTAAVNDFDKLNYKTGVLDPRYAQEQVYLISDFQRHEFSPWLPDSVHSLNAVQLAAEMKSNVSVDSVWLASPVRQAKESIGLKVKVSNHGETIVESGSLSFLLNGNKQAVQSFELAASQSKTIDIQFKADQSGWINGSISLDDPSLNFDNHYYFSLLVKAQRKVLELSSQASPFAEVFSDDQHFEFNAVHPLTFDVSTLAQYDLLISNQFEDLSAGLQQQIKEWVSGGGVLIFVPTPKQATQNLATLGVPSYGNKLLSDLSVDPAGLRHEFYQGVFSSLPKQVRMPNVKQYYKLGLDVTTDVILRLKGGAPLLTKTAIEYGAIYQFAFPLETEWSSFSENQLFVLTCLQAAFSGGSGDQLAYALDRKAAIYLNAKSGDKALSLKQGEEEVIVESGNVRNQFRYWLNDQLFKDGHYSVQFKGEADILGQIGLNYNRLESTPFYMEKEEIIEAFGGVVNYLQSSDSQLVNTLVEGQESKHLWKLFIWISLIFLLIEILLLRFYKS